MSERIDGWLSALDKSLNRRVTNAVREARVAEMRGHLHMSVRDAISAGASIEEAEMRAISALGNARYVAGDFIRQARGYQGKSAWLLAWLPILLTVIAGIVFLINYPNVPAWLTIWIAVAKWSGVPVFLAFAWQVWRTRRWLVLPVACVPLLMMIVALGVYRPHFSVFQVDNTFVTAKSKNPEDYRIALHDRLAQAKHDMRFATRIEETVKNGGHAPLRPDGFVIPSKSEVLYSAASPGTIYHLKVRGEPSYSLTHASFVDQATADSLWKEIGPAAIVNLRSQVTSLERAYARWEEGPPFNINQFLMTYGLAFSTLFANLLLLAAVNWGVLRIAELGRRLEIAR